MGTIGAVSTLLKDRGSATGDVTATDESSSCAFVRVFPLLKRFDAGGLDPVTGTSRLRCEVARRVCRASFSSILASALRASASSSFARRRCFLARRAASFASLRFCLAARDAVLAFSTNASAVIIRVRASCKGSDLVCEIFNEFNFIIQVNAPITPDYSRSSTNARI